MKKAKVIIGILLSIFFLWLAFLKVDFTELKAALESADYTLIIFAAFLNGFSFVPRAYRWKLLLKPLKESSFGNAFGCLSVGFMANSVLPARGGELLRAFIIGKIENISKSASFATILIERVLDLITLLLFMLIFLPLISNNPITYKIFWATLAIITLAIIFLITLEKNTKLTDFLVKLFPSQVKKRVRNFLEAFRKGLKILSDPKILFYTFLLSLFTWSFYAIVYYILFISFGLELSLGIAFIVLTISSLGISIPSSPGFIGTYHFLVTFSLGLFQVQKSVALSYSIAAWAVNFLPIVFIGFVALNKLGFSLLISRKKDT
jgi:glycosyltransferase 2 family protein